MSGQRDVWDTEFASRRHDEAIRLLSQLRLSYSNLEQEHLAHRLRELGLLSSIELGELSKDDAFNSEALVDKILDAGLVKDLRLAGMRVASPEKDCCRHSSGLGHP